MKKRNKVIDNAAAMKPDTDFKCRDWDSDAEVVAENESACDEMLNADKRMFGDIEEGNFSLGRYHDRVRHGPR